VEREVMCSVWEKVLMGLRVREKICVGEGSGEGSFAFSVEGVSGEEVETSGDDKGGLGALLTGLDVSW
jgi:hypothetical protein